MKAIEISKNIYWVGAIDWNLRNFHGYLTQRGSTYNAYLIVDERITLIDSTKPAFAGELLRSISDIIDPSKIDYIVSNHAEMDHSGGIPRILEAAPRARVVAAPKGVQALRAQFKQDWNFKTVKTGDVLNLGKRSLQFVLTPMVHWPDNMVCYCPEEKILFSNDAFGQHYASPERFDESDSLNIIMREAKKYYANIVLPYSNQVSNALKTVGELAIELIAPSHGVMWRDHIPEVLDSYTRWSSNTTSRKAVVVYDTMWKSTELLAQMIRDTFEEAGYAPVLCSLQHSHISDVMTELLDAEYIGVGSPTLNKTYLPTVAAFLTYLKGLSPGGRKAVAFGSYGWAPQGAADVEASLKASKFEVIDTIKCKYVPDGDQLSAMKDSLREKLGG